MELTEDEHSESEFYYGEEGENEFDVGTTVQPRENDNELTNSQQEIDSFLKDQKSENTNKKTTSDMKNFYRYLAQVNKERINILTLPANELDHLLSKFFKNVRKVDGDEYEPDTVSGFQRSIQRFLTDNKARYNILRDSEFEKSRQVLAAKRKNLVNKAGKGNKPNATRALTQEEEDKLFETGQFGCTSPQVLQRTMWWFLALHFGFRARDESRKLRWGDIQLQQDPVDGREMLVWLSERGTKTRKGQENGHRRSFQPKVYATESERCPVKYYKYFKSHRPAEMNTADAPFFLAIRHGNRRENNDVWYKKCPLGKNEIGKFLTKAADNAGLQRSGAKVSNHSVRKTSISRLLDANTPEIFVAQLSGHKSLQSLQSYKTASTQHQRQMSNVLSRTTQSAVSHQADQLRPSTPPSNRVENMHPTSSSLQTQLQSFETTASREVPDTNSQAVFAGANISSISGCQFQIFNGPVKILHEGSRKRLRIESDEED